MQNTLLVMGTCALLSACSAGTTVEPGQTQHALMSSPASAALFPADRVDSFAADPFVQGHLIRHESEELWLSHLVVLYSNDQSALDKTPGREYSRPRANPTDGTTWPFDITLFSCANHGATWDEIAFDRDVNEACVLLDADQTVRFEASDVAGQVRLRYEGTTPTGETIRGTFLTPQERMVGAEWNPNTPQ